MFRCRINPLFDLTPPEPPRAANLEAWNFSLSHEPVGRLLGQLQIIRDFSNGYYVGLHFGLHGVLIESVPREKIR